MYLYRDANKKLNYVFKCAKPKKTKKEQFYHDKKITNKKYTTNKNPHGKCFILFDGKFSPFSV